MASVARRGPVEAVVEGDAARHLLRAGRTHHRGDPGDDRRRRVERRSRGDLGAERSRAGSSPPSARSRAGAAIVPINTRWKGGEAAYVLAAARRDAAVHDGRLPRHRHRGMLAADPTELPAPALDRAAPRLAEVVASVPDADATALVHWDEFVAGGASVTEAAASERLAPCGRRTPATSCSRRAPPGKPKGVVMTHGQTVAAVHRVVRVRRARCPATAT